MLRTVTFADCGWFPVSLRLRLPGYARGLRLPFTHTFTVYAFLVATGWLTHLLHTIFAFTTAHTFVDSHYAPTAFVALRFTLRCVPVDYVRVYWVYLPVYVGLPAHWLFTHVVDLVYRTDAVRSPVYAVYTTRVRVAGYARLRLRTFLPPVAYVPRLLPILPFLGFCGYSSTPVTVTFGFAVTTHVSLATLFGLI